MSTRVLCFHCGDPCSPDSQIFTERDGASLPMCCHGCQAVSQLIFSSGLDRYYQFREGEGRRAPDDFEALAEIWKACEAQRQLWGRETKQGQRDLLLQTEGVHCAACAWLIRSRLEPQAGIERVQVDIGTGYTRIIWNPDVTTLSHIALELVRIGYRPHLPLEEDEERARLEERHNGMLRVGVAGLGMMQVMMYAVGLYAGDALGISPGAKRFLEWTSLLVSIPVVFYSGKPFLIAAVKSLKIRRPGMDVPVALAITVAFCASCINFLRGQGDVWFDSVVMFIFFLSAARYVQLVQRHRNLQSGAALARLLPEWARRLDQEGTKTILASDLQCGDLVKVRAGEPFPADGVIVNGTTDVDEALLTGESAQISRQEGDPVIGGSINHSQPVDIRVTAAGTDMTVSALGRMLLQSGSRDSRFTLMAEQVAGIFVVAVLVTALCAGVGWYFVDPAKALPVALAVLVVSCPCALSLATPAAVSAAGRSLLRMGVIMTRGDALEILPEVDVAVFDKTGTLTGGVPVIVATEINAEIQKLDEAQAMGIAAGLEAFSAHPLAQAFRNVVPSEGFTRVEVQPHGGISGCLEGQKWSIGTASYTGATYIGPDEDDRSVWLVNEQGWVARFAFSDEMRPATKTLMRALRTAGMKTIVASGDHHEAVQRVAQLSGVDEWHARQSPEMKIQVVRSWQQRGHRVMMVGDGVNDAPVLSEADVSVTVPGAADLANSTADLVLTGKSLIGLLSALDMARFTRRIIRQNLFWAIAYNAAAVPLAVGGWLQPWMAALGMSLSSLMVVANSTRLSRSNTSPSESDQIESREVPV
jgi:Cu2+-exporting ATPase